MEKNHVEMNYLVAMHDQILHLQNQLQNLHTKKKKLQPMHCNYRTVKSRENQRVDDDKQLKEIEIFDTKNNLKQLRTQKKSK